MNAFVLVRNGADFGGILFHLSTDGGWFQSEKIATQSSCLFAVVVVDWCTCFRRNVYILTKKKINYIQQLFIDLPGNLCSQLVCLANKIKAIDVSQI